MFCSEKYLIFQLKLKVEIVERNDEMTRYLKSKAQLVPKCYFSRMDRKIAVTLTLKAFERLSRCDMRRSSKVFLQRLATSRASEAKLRGDLHTPLRSFPFSLRRLANITPKSLGLKITINVSYS